MKHYLLPLAALLSAPSFAENAVVGAGTPASCTTSSYNAAIALVINDSQGGILTFNCGPNPHVIAVGSKNLANAITIDGGGKITLDGQNLNRIFTVSQDGPEGRTEVVIKNIDLNRGNSASEPFGGALLVNANTRLDLDRVSIRNSLASVSGGAVASFGDTVIAISNSQFISNLAANGGAIATRAAITVSGSSFINNTASGGEGGGIQSYEQTLTLSNSSFRGNSARFGGAVYKRDLRLNIISVDFSSNTSSADGGAIYVPAAASELRVVSSYFYDNVAAGNGGGIYSAAGLSAQFSSFGRNIARSGGAIHVDNAALNLLASTLHDNRAELAGAGANIIALSNNFPILLQFLTTSANTVSNGRGGDIAISASLPTDVLLFRSTLINGSANVGASIHASGQITLTSLASIVWPRLGQACVAQLPATLQTGGSNIGAAGCGFSHGTDTVATSLANLRLSGFGDNGGEHATFLPLPGSPAVDRFSDTFSSIDARALPSPTDGDGNGSIFADAGAVERQPFEDVIFRDGLD